MHYNRRQVAFDASDVHVRFLKFQRTGPNICYWELCIALIKSSSWEIDIKSVGLEECSTQLAVQVISVMGTILIAVSAIMVRPILAVCTDVLTPVGHLGMYTGYNMAMQTRVGLSIYC